MFYIVVAVVVAIYAPSAVCVNKLVLASVYVCYLMVRNDFIIGWSQTYVLYSIAFQMLLAMEEMQCVLKPVQL
jgi:hypothetical protein